MVSFFFVKFFLCEINHVRGLRINKSVLMMSDMDHNYVENASINYYLLLFFYCSLQPPPELT